jgi:hypothetical protein
MAVFPLRSNDKRPAIPEWQHRATTDLAQIGEWWGRWPGANIGLACGPSRLIVVDLDVKGADGLASWAELCERLGINGSETGTVTVTTPSGGRHLYYRAPEGADLANTAGRLGPGIDTRAGAGYVVAPPSVIDGTPYAWGEGREILPLPGALLALLANSTPASAPARAVEIPTRRDLAPYVREALDREIGAVSRASEGIRNDTLNRAAYNLGQLVSSPWADLDRATVEAELEHAARACDLPEREALATIASGLDAGTQHPRLEPGDSRAQAQAVNASPAGEGSDGDQVIESEQEPSTWPYAIAGGRLVYLTQKGDETITHKVADFWARIAEEITTEEDARSYLMRGQAVRGGDFEIEITAEDFADDRKLKAALDAAAGARDPVHAGMVKHLGPAIKLCTGSGLVRTNRFERTGWAGQRFLLPGREPAGVHIALPRKLPYASTPGDLAKGIIALEHIIKAMGPERGTVLLAFVLQGPAAALSDLRNERYALHVTGRTGALKTSTCQAAMSVWGSGFMADHVLTKWGEGATSNAIMALATHARDLPLLLDNFKPGTGGGVRAYVALLHNILEGGEKDRLNRAAELRETKPIFCWPLVTGEDIPDCEPSTLARILVLPFAWQRGEENKDLTQAQELAEHLPAVGAAWLDWLESDQGYERAREAGALFAGKRAEWAAHLRGLDSDMINVLRVASNLASNQLAYWLLRLHPAMGDLFDAYTEAHTAGLGAIAGTMAESTTEALEARAYLGALRDLLSADRAYLIPKEQEYPLTDKDHPYRPGFVGWADGDGGAYLIPSVARAMIESLIGRERLGHLGDGALYSQLSELGALASTTGDGSTKVIRAGGKIKRVLHIGRDFLTVKEAAEP